ncbi:MAG: AbrB/MazE/SpoVT family DNA-binding domain-containing protein [Acidimicrobiia bacterium]
MPRISSKHQITLPVAVLDTVGLRAGDEVAVRVEGSAIVIEPYADIVRMGAGQLTGRIDRSLLDELRDEWD